MRRDEDKLRLLVHTGHLSRAAVDANNIAVLELLRGMLRSNHGWYAVFPGYDCRMTEHAAVVGTDTGA